MLELRDQSDIAAGSSQLLMALAEQLKVPYQQIARRAELTLLTHAADPEAQLEQIQQTADAAMQQIDNYLFGMQLNAFQLALELSPVSVSSALHEASQQLSGYARQYGIELELTLTGRFEPVMANKQALVAAIYSLGQVFIETRSRESGKQVITLAAHRTNHGDITAGVFSGSDEISADMFRRARQLYGRARQPFTTVTAATGAGIFIADAIFKSMATKLRVAHHGTMSGLAASMLPSQQLAIV